MAETLELKINVDTEAALKHINDIKASLQQITQAANAFKTALGGSIPSTIPNGLKQTRTAADEANKSVINLRGTLAGLSGSSNSPVFTIDIISAARAFYDIIKDAVGLFVDGVKEVGTAISSQEKLNLSFGLNFGKQEGKEYRDDIERFSKFTSYNTQQIESHILPLYRAFGRDKGRDQFAIASDVAALSGKPTDINNTDNYIEFATRLHAREGVTKRQISSLLQGTGFDVNDLAKAAGGTDILKRAQKGGDKEAADRILYGFAKLIEQVNIKNGVKRDQNGNIIGGLGKLESETLGAKVNKLINLPFELFSKLAEDSSLSSLTEDLQKLYDVLSPSSVGGQKIISSLGEEFRNIVKGIKEFISDPAKIDDLITNTKLVISLFGDLGAGLVFLAKHIEGLMVTTGAFLISAGVASGFLGNFVAAAALGGAGLALTGGATYLSAKETEAYNEDHPEIEAARKAAQDKAYESDPIIKYLFPKKDIQQLPYKDMNNAGTTSAPVSNDNQGKVTIHAPISMQLHIDNNTNTDHANEIGKVAANSFKEHMLKILEQSNQQTGAA